MSQDQLILVTGGYDHTIKLWQANTGVCLRTMQHPESQINALEITPDKQMVAVCGFQHVRLYDLASQNPEPLCSYNGITKNVTRAGFEVEGKWMYTGSEDSTARIWDFRSRQCQRIFQVSSPVSAVCLHPNQGEILVGDHNGSIHLWDLKTDHNEQLALDPSTSISDIAIDQNGRYMAATTYSGHCYVWTLNDSNLGDPVNLTPMGKFVAHDKYVLRCQFSPDSNFLVTTSGDGTARIWSVTTHEKIAELTCPNQRWVWDAAFSLDSKYVFTGSSDGYARLWSIDSKTVVREYCGHQKAVTAMVFRDSIE